MTPPATAATNDSSPSRLDTGQLRWATATPSRGDQDATTEGIGVELVREGLWVQRGTSPEEWNCVFVPASDLYRLLNRELP